MENLGQGKVLLVEDDEKLAGLIAHFLPQHGFDVRVVHRGDLALTAFLEFKPKMVVLDLMLPGQSGLHVCREIRTVSDTPIVILTTKEDDLDHILGLESSADDYVIKPIKPPVLLARLRALQLSTTARNCLRSSCRKSPSGWSSGSASGMGGRCKCSIRSGAGRRFG
ncbi:Response regulator receiver domain-containing protein [Pseudomonas orientalis]|uniref:Response regulator receiver domain-containing protein n=1 Tax=Pseudomonas orientalis TaxID=76758 RepID=A0A8B3XUU8_9PSED|nr:Response regulator receiver domain-containing protein [Pseudomonas orientalis]